MKVSNSPKLYFSLIILLTLTVSCNPSIRDAYNQLVTPCVENDLTGKLLFFGPANNLSPGAVLRRQDDGGFGLAYRLRRLVENEEERNDMVDISNSGSCEGVAKLGKKLTGKISASDFVTNATLSGGLNQSKKMNATIQKFKWVTLEQVPFEAKVDELGSDDRKRKALLDDNAYVMTRALLVEGMVITYIFDQSIGASLKGKYEPAQLDNDLSGEWTNETTFNLKIDKPFYITGELRPYDEEGFSSAGTRFGELIEIIDNARVNTEKELIDSEF